MKNMLLELLVGSRKKQLISSTILLIVLFLVHVKNKNGNVEDIKIKQYHKDKKKVKIMLIQGGKGNVDAIFISRIRKLIKIVIPTWKSEEVLDLALLTVFLVLRTFLSIYLAAVNGKIVKAIIQRDLGLFIRRVTSKPNIDRKFGSDCFSCIIRELVPGVPEQTPFHQLQKKVDSLLPPTISERHDLLSVGEFG